MKKTTSSGKPDRRRTLEPAPMRRLIGTLSGDARVNPDRRTRMDRRRVYDRRELIRFEDDRRAGRERRIGIDPWAFP